VFTNEAPAGTVIFDVETKIIERFIAPGFEYSDLEIERTDYLPSYEGGSVTPISHPADHTANNPGPSRVPTEIEEEKLSTDIQLALSIQVTRYQRHKISGTSRIRRSETHCMGETSYMNMHIRQ
jgi:hypothetical protein